MSGLQNKFTLKIILSYLTLGMLTFVVGWFLFAEVKRYSEEDKILTENRKIIETGTLINLLYKTERFSRLALLTENDTDFEDYMARNDSLFFKIDEIKALSTDAFQHQQLDSIKLLLEEKNQNIEQLRILRLTNQKETSLDDIMVQVRKLEASVGLASVESMVREPGKLTANERRIWQSYADYLNSDKNRDTSTVKSKVVDSMLIASRYIVSEAKKENSRIRKSLIQKENELIHHDLNISERLRQIITSFDAEIIRQNKIEAEQRAAVLQRSVRILRYSGIVGGVFILLFSYYILSDFFRAERFKKNLEEAKIYAERLLKSREQLISTVSHDLKTPLHTISGYSQLFRNTTLTKKQEHYLEQIDTSSHFIAHLVDDLLDFSKLEVGKLALDSVPFSLTTIIREIGTNIQQSYPDKDIELILDIAEEIENQVFESDPLRIKQILNNLIGNAFKFTDNGFVKISVASIASNKTTSTVAIVVSDSGIGISKEKQHHIFEEFTQAEASISHRFGGSGLGLAIATKLVSLLEGSIRVESELGKGSTFTLTLPLKHSTRIQPKIASQETQKSLTAIVLDDDQTMCSLLLELFEQMGIKAHGFTRYSDLKRFMTEESPEFDFLLSDIQMPEKNGFDVLIDLQKGLLGPYQSHRVIAMTGSREHPISHFKEKGFCEVLRKPFSKNELAAAINNLFPNHITKEAIKDLENTTQKPTYKTFDLSLIESFLSTDEAIKEILISFNTQTNQDVETLTDAIASRKWSEVSAISHRMLTMFRQLRVTASIPLLETLETFPKQDFSTESITPVFETLLAQINALQKELNHALAHRFP